MGRPPVHETAYWAAHLTDRHAVNELMPKTLATATVDRPLRHAHHRAVLVSVTGQDSRPPLGRAWWPLAQLLGSDQEAVDLDRQRAGVDRPRLRRTPQPKTALRTDVRQRRPSPLSACRQQLLDL